LSSIPLPALDLKYQQQPSVLDQVNHVMALRSLMQGQQIQQAQLQGEQQKNEMGALQLRDQKAMTAAMQSWDGNDFNDLPGLVLKNGGSANAVMGLKNQLVDYQQKLANLTKDQLGNEKTKNDYFAQAIDNVKSLPADQQPTAFESAKQDAIQRGYLDPKQAQGLQYQGPQQLDLLEKSLTGHSAAVDAALKQSETAKNSTQAALDQIKLNLSKNSKPGDFDSIIDQAASPQGPNAALNTRTKSLVNFALQRGDVDSANRAITEMSNQLGSIEKETNPAVQSARLHLATMQKAAEQAIADGDPKAAGQLLVSGSVAPSQLISARRPSFAQQAFTEAQKLDPTWNAQKAEGDFKVASSPQNVGFFGSARSLTEKGGTLDQLAAAAKDIPANQFPVFNSVADAMRASTGSGPIARYASLTLGVADDYSKVMGGGQGSDTSRTQALNLISAKQSPEQRAASIEGIRGAVNSQIHSRIGNNTVLQKMYGVSGGTPQGLSPAAQALINKYSGGQQ
jgi:hypothetical protein